MNRVDRLVGILTTLQARKFVPAPSLAARYEISLRTVYRDIKALGEIGVPIGFEANKGYFVTPGYFLPPLSFTESEARSLLLVCALAKKFAGEAANKDVDSILQKVQACLHSDAKESLEHLGSKLRIFNPIEPFQLPDVIQEVQEALKTNSILSIHYTNNEGKSSVREIEPIGMTFYSNQWHIIAWCWKRNAYRDFKSTSITEIRNLNCSFRKKKHLDLNGYIKSLE